MDYSKQDLLLAIKAVQKGKRRISEASREFQVPESTIRAKIKGLYADKKPGPARDLTDDEELILVEWIDICCTRGMPINKEQLLESVKNICISEHRKNPFVENKPGRAWYDGFMLRHPDISERPSEKVSLNRGKVTKEEVQTWFKNVKKELKDNNLLNISSRRIFNTDETGIFLKNSFMYILSSNSGSFYIVVHSNDIFFRICNESFFSVESSCYKRNKKCL